LGIRALARKQDVLDSGTKSIRKTAIQIALERDRREREAMMKQMEAEGR